MVKICQTRLLKFNFETRPKKRIFRFLPKISAGHGWSWNFFLANFQIFGPLGCQGWVVIPQNVKKVKITAPYCTHLDYYLKHLFTICQRTIHRFSLHCKPQYSKDQTLSFFQWCLLELFGTWLGGIRITWGKSPEWFGRNPRLTKGQYRVYCQPMLPGETPVWSESSVVERNLLFHKVSNHWFSGRNLKG